MIEHLKISGNLEMKSRIKDYWRYRETLSLTKAAANKRGQPENDMLHHSRQ